MDLQDKARLVIDQVCRVILGKNEQVREVFLTFLANGHVLLEDMPGVGKTSMALAFGRAMALECGRVQLTPDVLPSDLCGFNLYRRELGKFVYQPGCVFTNLLLADELNRTSPKTQSALLEVMEERKVTVEGVTRELPQPFLVIATQNPMGSAGTQPLPTSQVDRFAVSASLGYPDFDSELQMAMGLGGQDRLSLVEPAVTREEFLAMQEAVRSVYIKESVCRYLLALVTLTRSHRYLEQGASPRATVALTRLVKAAAWLRGRSYVTPWDVAEQLPYVLSHRIVLNAAARLDGVRKEQVLQELLDSVKKPSLREKRQ